jgi:hypothetical protein
LFLNWRAGVLEGVVHVDLPTGRASFRLRDPALARGLPVYPRIVFDNAELSTEGRATEALLQRCPCWSMGTSDAGDAAGNARPTMATWCA